jgi:hypothetical protein
MWFCMKYLNKKAPVVFYSCSSKLNLIDFLRYYFQNYWRYYFQIVYIGFCSLFVMLTDRNVFAVLLAFRKWLSFRLGVVYDMFY